MSGDNVAAGDVLLLLQSILKQGLWNPDQVRDRYSGVPMEKTKKWRKKKTITMLPDMQLTYIVRN